MTKPPAAEVKRLTFEEYLAVGRVNFSALKEMRYSPAHYQYRLTHPLAPTPAMLFGAGAHTCTLEPERFPLENVIFTGDKRTKKWKEFQGANSDKRILTANEYELCLSIRDAVRKRPLPMKYLTGGKAEQVILWTDPDTGIKCKCRVDYDAEAIADIKTTTDPRPWAFRRDAYKYRYRTQAAMYRDAVKAATGEEKPYVIIAVEKDPPHEVVVYTVPEESLDRGRDEYGRWLERVAGCREHNVWPFEYADEEQELWEPDWALDEDDDVSGLGLTTGGVAV